MQHLIGKYSRHTVWLFALGAVVVGIAAAFATRGLGPKVTAGVYAAVVGIAGFASTFTTQARTRGAVAAFLVAALCAAVAYFLVVSYAFSTATTAVADVASNGAAHAEAAKVGSTFGKFFGAFAAVVAFLETAAVGIGGAVVGAKAKESGGLTPQLARG